jgi:hypothetical protein
MIIGSDSVPETIASTALLSGDATLTGVGSIGQNYAPITINYHPDRSHGAPQPAAYTAALKHLADREQQEAKIREVLVNNSNSRRPIIFFIHGDPAQCLDSFLDRICTGTVRKILRSIRGTDQVEWKMVLWPQSRGSENAPHDRLTTYLASVTAELEISPTADPASIAQRIADFRRPAIMSSVHKEIIGNEQSDTIAAVLDYWATLPDLPSELSLIIFIAIIHAEQTQQGLLRFLVRRTQSALSRGLASFDGYRPDTLRTVVLPELGNVTIEETEHWVRNVLRPVDIEEALKRARDGYGNKVSLPMALVEKQLDDLIPRYRARLRLQ